MRSKVLWLLMLLLPLSAYAANPDFYLIPNECKILVGSLTNGSLKITPGDQPSYGCSRQGEKLLCSVSYESGNKPRGNVTEAFLILVDSPPFLVFASDNRASFFSVNMEKRTVVLTSRMTDAAFLGEKVCTGIYATEFEIELLKQKQSK